MREPQATTDNIELEQPKNLPGGCVLVSVLVARLAIIGFESSKPARGKKVTEKKA